MSWVHRSVPSAELPVEVGLIDGWSWWQRTFGTIAANDGSEPGADDLLRRYDLLHFAQSLMRDTIQKAHFAVDS
jgi:hypothetical protein